MKFKKLLVCLFSVCMIAAVAGCNNTPASTSTAATEQTAETVDSLPNSNAPTATEVDSGEKLNTILNAEIGDTLDFNDYRIYQKSDGTKIYFANGKYVFVFENKVIETRSAVTVKKSGSSIKEILELDPSFDISKCKAYFYTASGDTVNWDIESHLTEEVTQALVEYVDWQDESETVGILHSYLFTYSDAPVSIKGVYSKTDVDAANAQTSASGDVTTAPEESAASSDVSETTAETEAPADTTTTTAASE